MDRVEGHTAQTQGICATLDMGSSPLTSYELVGLLGRVRLLRLCLGMLKYVTAAITASHT